LGEVNDRSRDYFLDVICQLNETGIDGVILGCTEIGLLIQQDEVQLPVLDTTSIHAQSLVDFAMKN
jgi:aspartate racemase